MLECYHTKGNRHIKGEFEVYRVVLGEIAFVQTSPQLKDISVTLAKRGDMFNVIPYYFHRAINISPNQSLVTSDIRPLNTKTSYSPVEEEGFPINIVRNETQLLLRKKNGETVPLVGGEPEVKHPIHHSNISIDELLITQIIEAAQKKKLEIGKPYQDTGYIVSSIRKVSDMNEFYLNSEAAAKIDDIAYITLDGRLDEINMINGLTIILPGGVLL